MGQTTNREDSLPLVIIPAAGSGERMQHAMPKAFIPIGDTVILAKTINALQNMPQIGEIIIVINPKHQALLDDMLAQYSNATSNPIATDGLHICHGGAHRQDSVRAGLDYALEHCQPLPRMVMIHDAARPFITAPLIEDLLGASAEHPDAGIIPSLPLADTIKQIHTDNKITTLPREQLISVQTPQLFPLIALHQLHHQLQAQDFTDDASLFEHADKKIIAVAGQVGNIKITYRKDLNHEANQHMTAMEYRMEYRSATGFDVHQFCEGESITLCGVTFPFERSLLGHSDADVALHAITDAIFASIADGDIGAHFPPSDEKWRGADSTIFLQHALQKLSEHQAQLTFCDLTLICERPKLRPLHAQLQTNLAHLLSLPISRVSLKATTTEKLGFTGREEGIAALATINIKLPE